jgi:hypothetical protein
VYHNYAFKLAIKTAFFPLMGLIEASISINKRDRAVHLIAFPDNVGATYLIFVISAYNWF